MNRLRIGRMLTVVALALAGCPAAPAGVLAIPDIRYATTPGVEANLQSLDIYLPDPAPLGPMPVVIWVHGGAWKGGDKAYKMQYKPPLFTGVGYCFVSVNYRLSPDPFDVGDPTRVMHPIHVQDVATAIAWVHTNIASYGGDVARMALLGHSAGGHLVSLVSTDESFLAAHGLPLTVIKGTAELDSEGLDIPAKMDNDPGNEMILNAFGDDPLVWAAASPMNHLTAGKGIPPFLVAKRGNEFRQGMAEAFAAGIQGAGSSATIVDTSVYTHEEVNENVGVPGETVITPPLMTFFAGIFGGTQPTTPFVLTQTSATLEPESSTLFDMNDDGALDILLAANPQIAYARNIGGCQFQPVMTWDVSRAKGFGLHDFNLDGRLDPFIAQPPESDGSGPPNGPDCAINNGDGTLTFLDKGNNAICRNRTVVFDDFDGDGWLDALHPTSSFDENHFWPELHRGLPGGVFDPANSIDTDMPAPFWHEYVDTCPAAVGEWANAWMKGCVIRDLDQDGKADVVMVAWADAGFPDPRCRDAHQEFVNEHSYRGIFVLRNVSTPDAIQFQDVSHAAIGPHAYGNTAADWEFYAPVPFDYDLDGDLDLFMAGLTTVEADNPTLLLLRNDSVPGTIAFTDVTSTAGALNDINSLPTAERVEIRFSDGAPIDYDNDGLVDIAVTNRHDGAPGGGEFVYLFRNLGNGVFSLLDGTASGLAQFSNALNYGDLDQDGRLDLVVHDKFHTGDTYVYRNVATNSNHWVQLNIRDSATGTYAFGARVTVYQAGTSTVLGTDEVRTDYSYRSKRTPILHFGLGPVESVDVRVVRPYNGGEAWFRGRSADTVHTLILKGNSTITVTGATSYTYSGNPQGPDTADVTGSTGAVTYSYSGTGSTSYGPSPTKPTNAGTYEVVATVAEDANYYGATSAPLAFTITPKPLTVTTDAKSKVYGQTDPALTWQITSGALEPGDAMTGALTRVAGENVGAYPIQQGTLTAGANYNITYVPANLTITPKPLTVTADAKSKVYGQPDPALTWQITSGALESGDTMSGALSRVAGENVGAYPIQQGTLTAGANYSITYAPANLSITAKPITVTADAKSKVYGQTDPALTWQITSGALEPGDFIGGALTRVAGENVGAYPIQQGTLTAGANYSIIYVPANLTIDRATVTVTLVDVIKIWDGTTGVTLAQANFAPQGLVSGESLVISQTTGAFSSPDVGVNIPVSAVLTGFIAAGPGTDLGNYNLPATANGLGTITAKQIPVVTWPAASAIVFGQALSQSTLTGGSATDPGTGDPVAGVFAFDNAGIVPPMAGSYNADVTFTPTDGATYESRQTQIPVEVQKAPATATLGSLSPTYDGLPKTATATTVPPGLMVNFTYDGSPPAPTHAGSYAVVGVIDDPNHQGSASGTLAIARAAITVTADGKTKDVGAPDPVLTYQITSGALAPGDSLSGALTREPGETAGTYAILQGTLTAGPNYDLTYVGADLVIMGPPFALLYTGPNPVIVRTNDRVEITVEAVNYTGDVDYQWYKVSPGKAWVPIQGANGPMLVIEHAALDDAGLYLCEAALEIDLAWSPYIELQVEDTPGLPVTSLMGLVVLVATLVVAAACIRTKAERKMS